MTEENKEVQIIHFHGGGELTVEYYEENPSRTMTSFSGRVMELHRIRYSGGAEGYVTDEQVKSVESATENVWNCRPGRAFG